MKWAVWTPTIVTTYIDGKLVDQREDWEEGGHYATIEVSIEVEDGESPALQSAGIHATVPGGEGRSGNS